MNDPDLSPNEYKALLRFVEYLRDELAERVNTIALFGSKARGDGQPDSDLDVLVIIQEDDRALRREILKQASRISLEFDLILSPRVIDTPRWRQMRGFSLFHNVVRDAAGLVIREEELILEAAGPELY